MRSLKLIFVPIQTRRCWTTMLLSADESDHASRKLWHACFKLWLIGIVTRANRNPS